MSAHELTILREHAATEARIVAEVESPREHVANAIQILDSIGHPLTYAYLDGQLDGVRDRLQRALSALDAATEARVSSDDSAEIAMLVDDLQEAPWRFAERYLRLERAVRGGR